MHSSGLYLLVGSYSSFKFNVIINMYVPNTILLIAWIYFCRSFFFLSSLVPISCDLMTIFSVVFGLLFHFVYVSIVF